MIWSEIRCRSRVGHFDRENRVGPFEHDNRGGGAMPDGLRDVAHLPPHLGDEARAGFRQVHRAGDVRDVVEELRL